MAADINQLKKQIDDLREQYLKLTAKPAALFQVSNIKDAEQAIETLNKAVSQAREEAKRLEEGFGGIADSVTAIVNELGKSKTPLNLATSAFRQIEESAKKLKFDQQGINDLNKKQLEDEIKKQKIAQQTIREQALQIAQEKGIVDISKTNLRFRHDLSDAERSILEALKEGFPIFDEINNKLDKRLDKEKEFQKSLGISGKLAGAFGKIPFFGEGASQALKDTEEEIRALDRAGKPVPNRFQTMGMLIKNLKGSIKDTLTDPLVLFSAAAAGITSIFKKIDELTTGTARNFGISKNEANDLNKELSGIARSSNDNFITTSKLNESFQSLNNRYGTFADFNEENLVTFTELTKKAGVSAEAVGALQDTTFLTGKNLKESTAEFEGQVKALKAQTGLAINEKQVLEGIKDVSAATKLQLGGSTKAIAEAVFKAKALGMELKDLNSISNSLLNFQSSIEDELSAELLTGKQLNLEGARYAALIGDQAMLADEVAKSVGSAADFQKMNVLQQESLAKSLGLTRDTLAETLMQREALSKLGAKDGETQKEAYDRLVAQYGVEEARKRIGDENLANQLESASIQEKFASITEKLQEAFIPLAEALLPIVDGFASLVSNATLLKTVLGIVSGAILGNMAVGLGQSISKMGILLGLSTAKAAAETSAATAVSFGAMLPVILGSVGAIVGLISGLKSANDLYSPGSGYGNRILLAPEGAFALNNKDNIIATTNPVPVNDMISKPKGAINVAPQQVSQQRSEIKVAPSNTQIAINLDGAALGNASARSNYSVGSNIKSLGGKVDYSAPI